MDGAAGDSPFSTVAPEPSAVGHDWEQGHFASVLWWGGKAPFILFFKILFSNKLILKIKLCTMHKILNTWNEYGFAAKDDKELKILIVDMRD